MSGRARKAPQFRHWFAMQSVNSTRRTWKSAGKPWRPLLDSEGGASRMWTPSSMCGNCARTIAWRDFISNGVAKSERSYRFGHTYRGVTRSRPADCVAMADSSAIEGENPILACQRGRDLEWSAAGRIRDHGLPVRIDDLPANRWPDRPAGRRISPRISKKPRVADGRCPHRRRRRSQWRRALDSKSQTFPDERN